jgi:hypothetical protein
VPQRIESAATASRIATLDLPAGIVTLPSPAAEIESDTPPTEKAVAGVNVAEIGSRPGSPAAISVRDYLPMLRITKKWLPAGLVQ